jgi:hypothetical protein
VVLAFVNCNQLLQDIWVSHPLLMTAFAFNSHSESLCRCFARLSPSHVLWCMAMHHIDRAMAPHVPLVLLRISLLSRSACGSIPLARSVGDLLRRRHYPTSMDRDVVCVLLRETWPLLSVVHHVARTQPGSRVPALQATSGTWWTLVIFLKSPKRGKQRETMWLLSFEH